MLGDNLCFCKGICKGTICCARKLMQVKMSNYYPSFKFFQHLVLLLGVKEN
jgi:hypothetical protein